MKVLRLLLKYSVVAFFATVGLLIACGLLLSLAEGLAAAKLLEVFGWGGIVVTGLLGTPVHELGHWLACKLFGLQVTDVSLFRPIAGKLDGMLGYVNFTYHTSSVKDMLGCFFAGIAPMIIGALVIILIIFLLTPEVWKQIRFRMNRLSKKTTNPLTLMKTAIGGYMEGFGSLRGFGIVRGLVSLYMICSVSMHMSLSAADLIGAAVGLTAVFALCVLYALIALLAGWNVGRQLARTAGALAAFFSVGTVLCAVSFGFAALTQFLSGAIAGTL